GELLALGRIGYEHRVTLVAHDPAVGDPARPKFARELDRRLRRARSATVHSGVDLDDRAEPRVRARGRRVERGDLFGGVDRDDRFGQRARELDQPRELRRADELVRDQHARAHAAGGERLGLAELRAGDADRAGGELQLRDLYALRRLPVRAQLRRLVRE